MANAVITESQVKRITNAAIDLMVRRANVTDAYQTFTSENIVSAVVSDPLGETARYLAQLIAWGVEWLRAFRTMPELLAVWGEA